MRNCYWLGNYSSDFDDPRNWKDGAVPQDGDSVHVMTANPMGLPRRSLVLGNLSIECDGAHVGLAPTPSVMYTLA